MTTEQDIQTYRVNVDSEHVEGVTSVFAPCQAAATTGAAETTEGYSYRLIEVNTEDQAFFTIALAGFSREWEGPEDSIYDDFFDDDNLQ